MNFADFSFWWTLISCSAIVLTLRYLGQCFQIWQSRWDRVGLMVISLVIFHTAAKESFLIFIFELIFNYLMVNLALRLQGWKAMAIAAMTVVADLLLLAYFKYLPFLFKDLLGIAAPQTAGNSIFPDLRQIPPGISFYTFQMVAFVIDSVRVKRSLGLIDYINFTSFFPQVVAGPIERRADLLPQMQSFRFKFRVQNLELGLRWVVLGLFMKLVLSDNMAELIQLSETANAWMIWLSIYLFGLRIYFDFAGYSSIALGLAQILGIKLTLNFVAPYVAHNVQDFWRRWHITLSTWFRDYLYLPLGGAKVAWAGCNVMIVFAVSGLWHGAGWNFVLWGVYHGVLLVFHRYVGRKVTIPRFFAWLLTFAAVMFGWLFFMETDVSQLLLKLQTLGTPRAYAIANLKAIENEELLMSVLALCSAFLMVEQLATVRQRSNPYEWLLSQWATRLLLGCTILFASVKASSDFIYFAF